ncbi:hypothetical protein AB1K70_00585 [Bremerella sp. JC770]|uniref:hypothetical protein n=1 Tax=Bremerella sp. JC770 TaxID=3232137 RepID=UPI0034581960
MYRFVPYVVTAVVALNLIMWIVGKTPAIEIIDEAIPIGQRGIVPGGRRPAGISRALAPVRNICWAVMTFTWPHPLIGLLSMTLEAGVLSGLCMAFERARHSSSGKRRRVPSWTGPDDAPNPYDSPDS